MPRRFKPRLQRLEWLYTSSPLYFVTTATLQRRRLLNQQSVHLALQTFAENARKRGVLVGRYVLMPDHLHLFVAIAPGGPPLSKWIQMLKISLSKTLRSHAKRGTVWQKGFFDHVLRSAESYNAKWEYVRQNPVRAGLVSVADEWPFQGEIVKLAFL